jgi:mRNA interferase MazF
MCVPVYASHDGLLTQVAIGPNEGLAHASSLHCDEVVTIRKEFLRDYVGSLTPTKLREVNRALAIALDIDPDDLEDL